MEGLFRRSIVGGALTADGLLVIAGGVSLAFGTVGLAVLAGLFFKQRWAWASAMTWATLSLVLGLVAYFAGAPEYWPMLGRRGVHTGPQPGLGAADVRQGDRGGPSGEGGAER